MEPFEQAPLPADAPLEPRAKGCPVPLLPRQLFWWKGWIQQQRSMRLRAASVRIVGALDTHLLRESIEAVIQRHESLRTRIVLVDGVPQQHIDATRDDCFQLVDLTKLSSIDAELESKRLAQDFVEQRIDLSEGPLFEARLMRLSNREHVLILTLDHIIADAVSCEILRRDIWGLYDHSKHEPPFSLPSLPVQFADYAVWQQRTYSAWRKEHESYWKSRLMGVPGIQIPRDTTSVGVERPALATFQVPFGKKQTVKLRELARREGILLPIVILAVYVATMARWCDQRDFILIFASHGRHHRPDLQNMIGPLANLLFLRIEIERQDSFIDLLKRVDLEFKSAYQHRDFNRVPQLMPECTTELSFNWLPGNGVLSSADHLRKKSEDALRIQSFPLKGTALPDAILLPFFSDTVAGVIMTVVYHPGLFELSTIEKFGNNLRSFATECVDRPLVRASYLS